MSHSEEIAFFRGNEWEKKKINDAFNVLLEHINSVLLKRLFMGVFDSMLVKYGAVILGYSILALPVFGKRAQTYKLQASNDYVGSITKDYIKNSGLLINLARVILF
jgi:ATP-binding cassette subfamily D (ALD) protein 3